jgi:hypothetical protein
VLVECVNLLWNLVEASPLALSIFNQMSLMDVVLPLLAADNDPSLGKHQCCGSGSRIRCFFDPWNRIRDRFFLRISDPEHIFLRV